MFHITYCEYTTNGETQWNSPLPFSYLTQPTAFSLLFLISNDSSIWSLLNRSILKVNSCLFAQYTQQQVSKYQMWPFIYSKASKKRHTKSVVFSSQLKRKKKAIQRTVSLLQNWSHKLKCHVSKVYILVYTYSSIHVSIIDSNTQIFMLLCQL